MTHADAALGWPADPPTAGRPGPATPNTGANGHHPGNPAPRDLDAERAVLGACLAGGLTAVTETRQHITHADDFYLPRHTLIWQHITTLADRGVTPDLITVPRRAAESGARWSDDDRHYLVELYEQAPIVLQAGWHAQAVAEQARLRRLHDGAIRLQALTQQAGGALTDPNRRAELVDQIRQAVDDLAGQQATTAGPQALELDQFLQEPGDHYDWLVPGLLERGDRVILTGAEGKGKSTLLRQVAVQLAAGIHPFTLEAIERVRVLYVDLENTDRQVRRKLRALRVQAGEQYQLAPGLHIRVRTEGLDLLDADDARWLTQVVGDIQPDLLITGPIYKLAGGDPTAEEPAKAATRWLDRLRVDIGCTLIIEGHTPYASNGGRRPERPYGASLWSRWPEFGLYLAPEGKIRQLRHWRGARDERQWPGALTMGGEWPWMAVTNDNELYWVRIVEECEKEGDQLSERELSKRVGAPKTTIHRIILAHQPEWAALAATTQGELPLSDLGE